MIRTKTSAFCQKLTLELRSVIAQKELLERWNMDEALIDDMLDEYKSLVNRMQAIIREMNNLCTDEWSAIYQEQQELAKAEALSEDFAPAADGSGMPSDGAGMPNDGVCKEAE